MIMEAIRRGVSEEDREDLNVDVAAIRRKRDLLTAFAPRRCNCSKEKHAYAAVFRELRKVKPIRQIEMAELMVAANNFSRQYAECLFAATPQDQLFEPETPKAVRGLIKGNEEQM